MVFMEKKLTKEDIKCYKTTEREIFKRFSNLSNDKLNKISNKFAYVKNTIMTNIIKHCRGEKKQRNKSSSRTCSKVKNSNNICKRKNT